MMFECGSPGKTTTTAKLAARCVLRHGASKVALITTDGYRIGAHEQLRIYGRILGVSVHLVKDADDLKQTLFDLRHKHMVLVDTMGMSQRDRMVGEQVAMFGNSNVKRLLLLCATSRGDTLDDVVRAYNGPDLAGCILSKVDVRRAWRRRSTSSSATISACTTSPTASACRKTCICRTAPTCCTAPSRTCRKSRRIASTASNPGW